MMRYSSWFSWVWRNKTTRFHEHNMVPRDRFSDGSVMVWGTIAWGTKFSLEIINGSMTSVIYRDMLDKVAVQVVIDAVGPDFIFQDDDTKPHLSTIFMD